MNAHTTQTDLNAFKPRLEPVTYGELVVVGYNGTISPYHTHDGTRKSRYELNKRKSANGVRVTSSYRYRERQRPAAPGENRWHIVVEKRNGITLVQEFSHDPRYDIFQIGRYKTNPIDVHVNETVPESQREEKSRRVDEKSTVSRFACRILIERSPPYSAFVFAGAFNTYNQIVLSHEKQRMSYVDEMDVEGFTPNGILILHPNNPDIMGSAQWRELSVVGNSYTPEGIWIPEHRNILEDCSLIDLNGVVLIWRSHNAIREGMTPAILDKYITSFNQNKIMCVTSKCHLTLNKCNNLNENPWVNFECGHISCGNCSHPIREVDTGLDNRHNVENNINSSTHHSNKYHIRTCPICEVESRCNQIKLGVETSLFIGDEPLDHCYLPCCHLTNRLTAQFWSELQIRVIKFYTVRQCPFCANPLDKENKPFVRLISSDNNISESIANYQKN